MTETTDLADHTPRRRPSQARSRARFDQILEAASDLIAERGLEPITMTEIAAAAGMGLPAVYRYFPNKTAIVRELAILQLEASADLNDGLGSDPDLPVAERIREGIKAYCAFLNDPVRLQVRTAIHGDAELSQLDLDDSRRNAAVIAAAVDSDGLGIGRFELERRALLLVELLDGVVRLASRVDGEEAAIAVNTFAEIAAWTLLRPEPFKEIQ